MALGSLALLLGGSISDAYGESERADVVGHVYVNDNTAGTNTIGAFDRHKNGSLTPMAGSPFSAGSAGAGAIVGSQGALQISGDGRVLLAADAGTNQFSVLRIRADGSLQAVTGSPVARAAFSQSASRSTMTWYTSPTRATAAPAATTLALP